MANENYINHIALILDESSSMGPHRDSLIKVADAQIAHLARRSKELDQETRVTVYTFADTAKCLIYDKDVLRLPSLAGLYRPNGWTALVDATMLGLNDLAMTPEKYGDHSFLVFVLTDGQENRSKTPALMLKTKLDGLADHWTVAVLVPDQLSKHEAKRFGFPAGNIAVWDPSTGQGLEEAMETIQAATDSYMTSRAFGIRSTKTLFGGAAQVNAQTVAATGLKPLDPGKYLLHPIPGIPDKTQVQEYITSKLGLPFRLGTVFYQLMKPEKIQAGKVLAVLEKGTDKLYMGPQVRDLLGLPALEVRIHPDSNPNYKIFVQSNSTNRHLVSHTTLLIMR
jgi:hypothetical protein